MQQVVCDDFMRWRKKELRLSEESETVKVVANLPYNITTNILKRLLPMGDHITEVVLMVQVANFHHSFFKKTLNSECKGSVPFKWRRISSEFAHLRTPTTLVFVWTMQLCLMFIFMFVFVLMLMFVSG
jgi:hypothetical protein